MLHKRADDVLSGLFQTSFVLQGACESESSSECRSEDDFWPPVRLYSPGQIALTPVPLGSPLQFELSLTTPLLREVRVTMYFWAFPLEYSFGVSQQGGGQLPFSVYAAREACEEMKMFALRSPRMFFFVIQAACTASSAEAAGEERGGSRGATVSSAGAASGGPKVNTARGLKRLGLPTAI